MTIAFEAIIARKLPVYENLFVYGNEKAVRFSPPSESITNK